MKNAIGLGLLLALGLAGQEAKPAPPPEQVQRIVDVKYADVRQLAELLNHPNMNIRFNEHFRTISLFGTPTAVQNAESIIKRYDVAGPQVRSARQNIEAVFYLLVASPKGTAGEALPSELDGVAKQMTSIFGYRDFRLMDSTVLRGREGTELTGSGSAASSAGETGIPKIAPYQISIQNTGITAGEKGNVIRMDRFRFSIRMPYRTAENQWNFAEVGFNTNLDVREGQKAVVGKAKFDGTDSALVLVVTARAVD